MKWPRQSKPVKLRFARARRDDLKTLHPAHFALAMATGIVALDWGGVFPLGMYSVSTCSLTEILDTPFLFGPSRAFAIIALAAWLLALFGLLQQPLSGRRSSQS
jgi:tellurite resistance protein TehA-like permease